MAWVNAPWRHPDQRLVRRSFDTTTKVINDHEAARWWMLKLPTVEAALYQGKWLPLAEYLRRMRKDGWELFATDPVTVGGYSVTRRQYNALLAAAQGSTYTSYVPVSRVGTRLYFRRAA